MFLGTVKMIDWILEVIKYVKNSDIYYIFECFVAVKTDLSLYYNNRGGFD